MIYDVWCVMCDFNKLLQFVNSKIKLIYSVKNTGYSNMVKYPNFAIQS